ncbi:MAG: ABC transporter permease [Dehalococcoidia bacterium]|nr:ABC transporter permease [Chloroflexota bacterium]MXW25357.1 ABC transporter permease [Dehalococcoidia bacterium]MXZ87251.1 ABC transporter permease [Dehalococcoidia bacterium]MYA53022.1 ABC transporter permease [Dehalococcoidia bacterium]
MSAVTLDAELELSWWGRKTRESLLFSTINGIIRNPQGMVAIIGLVLLVVGAVGAPVIAQYDPVDQGAAGRFLAPSTDHWFGTDELRRDLFSRTLFGLRASLAVSLISVAVGTSIGVTIGFLAGFIGGLLEAAAMRLVDALLAFPGLIAALAILNILGPGVRSIGIAIAFFTIPAFARLARAQMLAEKNKDYVLASQALGASPQRVVFRHIAINAFPPLLTQMALLMAVAVLITAALSFLGLGDNPPAPSLGGLLNVSRQYLREAWWYAVFPGAVFALLLFSLNLLSDAINEASSPYQRRR